MSKGRPIGHCKTCGSEIAEHVNDGVFGHGDCESCEYQKYLANADSEDRDDSV